MWMIGRDIRKLVDNGDRERLLWLSRNEDAHIRAEAALALGELGGPGSVQPLIRLLEESTEDNEVRSCAAFALGKIGDAHAVDPLAEALRDDSLGLPLYAVRALGEIGDPQAVEPLTKVLGHYWFAVRGDAALALGRIGDARAERSLVEALKDRTKDVRKKAARALEQLGYKPGKDEIGALYCIALGKPEECIDIGQPAVRALIEVLFGFDNFDCLCAAYCLGEIGDSLAVVPLLCNTIRQWHAIRDEAALALGKIGDPRARESLMRMLEDENADVRRKAAEALDQLGYKPEEDEVGALYWIAKGKSEECIHIGQQAVKPLIKALQDPDDIVCLFAVYCLGEIGDPQAVEPLIRAGGRMNREVQKFIREALRRLT